MSRLSSLFKTKKQNLTPDVTPLLPFQINPKKYGELDQLSSDFIAGRGTGFGQDYVDKSVNPVAEARRRNFRNVTSPLLSSEYSKRGISRSNLAADAQGRAAGDVEDEIGQMMAQFFSLNEAQKKADQQFGANLGQNILTGDVSAQQNQATASERLANATATNAQYREQQDTSKSGKIVGTLMNALVPGSGMAFMGGQQPQIPGQTQGVQTNTQIGTRTLDDNDYETLAKIIKKLQSQGA